MGCAASSSSSAAATDKLTIATLNLSRKEGNRPVTLANAQLAAKFCPMLTPAEILQWLEDPILPLELPEDVPFMTFQLIVPHDAVQRADGLVNFPTTLRLLNGKRVACRQQAVAGATLSAIVPLAALQAMGQWSPEAFVAHDVDRSLLPILQRDLNRALPVLSADHALPEDRVDCAVCGEDLRKRVPNNSPPMMQRVPNNSPPVIRRLPCGHFYHARCIDTWLTGHERTCPTCRVVVLPELPAAVDASSNTAREAVEEGGGGDDEQGVDAAWERRYDYSAAHARADSDNQQAMLSANLSVIIRV